MLRSNYSHSNLKHIYHLSLGKFGDMPETLPYNNIHVVLNYDAKLIGNAIHNPNNIKSENVPVYVTGLYSYIEFEFYGSWNHTSIQGYHKIKLYLTKGQNTNTTPSIIQYESLSVSSKPIFWIHKIDWIDGLAHINIGYALPNFGNGVIMKIKSDHPMQTNCQLEVIDNLICNARFNDTYYYYHPNTITSKEYTYYRVLYEAPEPHKPTPSYTTLNLNDSIDNFDQIIITLSNTALGRSVDMYNLIYNVKDIVYSDGEGDNQLGDYSAIFHGNDKGFSGLYFRTNKRQIYVAANLNANDSAIIKIIGIKF